MRASTIESGKLVTKDTEKPVPSNGQVLVRNLACGICGSDLHLFKMVEKSAEAFEGMVLGHEFCAEILEFGPNTQQLHSVGQRVCSIPYLKSGESQDPIGVSEKTPGAYSEYMLLSEDFLVAVPDATPTEAAALVEPLAVAIHAVAKSNLKANDKVLVMGTGPIGLAIIAVLKLRGINAIVASDFSAMRRSLARKMGATLSVDPADHSPFEDLASLTEADTNNALIFDCIGAKGLLADICRQAPDKSRVVIAGLCTEEDKFNPFIAMTKELNIQFVFYYQTEEFSEALQILSENKINWRPLVTGKVGLDGIAGAFQALQNPESHAKIIIDPWLSGDEIISVSL